MNSYAIAAVLLILVFIFVPIWIKKQTYKQCMKDLEHADFTSFEKRIDSLPAKMAFSAFDRECLRLSQYEAMGDLKQADQQVQFMESMRLNRKQRAILGERGFYVYLASGKVKKARAMVELVEKNGTPQQVEPIQMNYSILLKKESKYISVCKTRYQAIWDGKSELNNVTKMRAGTMEYLLGLQYFYEKDKENTIHWMKLAQDHLADTPYEEDIERILDEAKSFA